MGPPHQDGGGSLAAGAPDTRSPAPGRLDQNPDPRAAGTNGNGEERGGRVMPQAEAPVRPRGSRKVRKGIVTSNKMQKTIVVQVTRTVKHPVYERVIKRANSFKVHDERNEAKIGDLVEMMETRPQSKDKRWRLVRILLTASTAPAVPEAESERLRVQHAEEREARAKEAEAAAAADATTAEETAGA